MYHGAEWPKSLLTPACAQTCAAPLDMSGQMQEHLADDLGRGGEGDGGAGEVHDAFIVLAVAARCLNRRLQHRLEQVKHMRLRRRLQPQQPTRATVDLDISCQVRFLCAQVAEEILRRRLQPARRHN